MKVNLFKITCLTNLHVGSGDENYGIVDKEVETDPITGYPIIHGSGIKGALRDFVEKNQGSEMADRIFGSEGNRDKGNPGEYVFFDAKFLFRPLRVSNSNGKAYTNVTTEDAINDFLSLTKSFDCKPVNIDVLSGINYGNRFFASNQPGIEIEGEPVSSLNIPQNEKDAVKSILGNDNFAFAQNINEYDLPVIARNNIGEHRNLWYEEFVPYNSVFYMLVLTPDDKEYEIDINMPVQLGGNSTVGYGYVKFERM